MGNFGSCNLISPKMKSGKAARVVLPGGEVRQFRETVKAAELMLDCPSFFLVNSRSLNIGQRFSALSADEDLELGNVYIMFPMRRVNTAVMAADVAVLLMAANSASKRISGGQTRISPEATTDATAAKTEKHEEGGEVSQENDNGRSGLNLEEVEGLPELMFMRRLSLCRSKKPMLDTITEEPVCAR